MSTTASETPVLDLLATMTVASVEQSELDPRSLMLVRLAALAAVDAPPVSYLTNLAVASDVGVTAEDVEQVLIGGRIPETMDGNVRVGVAYLHHLLHRFGMNARLALGAYYSGPAAVMRRGLSRPTRRFVASVLALRGRA